MDTKFEPFITKAADIATAGRWKSLTAKLDTLASGTDSEKKWWVLLFHSLAKRMFTEYLLLKKEYETPGCDPSLLAWRARNLLELFVWSLYCGDNVENARRVFDDAGRDILGLHDTFVKWGASIAERSWIESLERQKQDVATRAGIESLEGSYKRVRDAARECGIEEVFSINYAMLSKLAHPTAFAILAAEDTTMFRDALFGNGCASFVCAFEPLEARLNEPF